MERNFWQFKILAIQIEYKAFFSLFVDVLGLNDCEGISFTFELF